MDREGRKRIFEENLEILAERRYTTPDGYEPEFKNQFKEVVFAILEDRNSLKNSITGNYLPFKKEFERCVDTK